MRAIVIIEDDTPFRVSLGRLLTIEGFDVIQFESAEAYLTAPPMDAACLLTDINLPGMSGVELVQQVRQNGSAPPVVLMTGRADPETRRHAIQLGCTAVLWKPFTTEALLATIRSIVT